MGKTKLQEAQEEVDEKQAEELQRIVESMAAGSTEKIRRFMALPVIYCAAMIARTIPNFTRDMYLPPSSFDQPFTSYFSTKFPSPSQFVAPLIFVLITYYIIICRGSIMSASLVTIQFIYSEVVYSYASQNIVVSICLILMMISLILSRSLLENDPYSMKWFVYYASSMTCALLPMYVSVNYAGFTVASYIACFISSFSRFGDVRGSKVRLIVESFLLLVTSYIVIFPLLYVLLKLHDSEDANVYQHYSISLSDYLIEFKKRSDPFTLVTILISFGMLRFGRYRYVNVVPLIQIFVGVLCTIFIPYETPGESVASRFFIIKTLLMIGAGIIFSAAKHPFVTYGIPALLCVVTLAFHFFQYFTHSNF